MSKNFTKISGSRVQFGLTIDEKDFQAAQKKIIQQHKENVSAKGFRKGHAPDNVVIASLGIERLANESIDQALTDHYRHFIEKNKLQVINRPEVDFPKKEGFPMKVTVSVEVFPEIEVKDYHKIKMKKPEVKVTEKELDEIIETLLAQAQIGTAVTRAAKSKDLIEADFAGKDKDGKVLPSTNLEKTKFRIGLGHYLSDLEKAFEGMKAGEEKKAVKVRFPKDYHSADFAGKDVPFDIKLHGVYEIDPKAITESDIEKITGQKQSVEEFRKMLQENVENRQRQQKEDEAINAYQSELSKKVKGDLPASWIDQEVASSLQRVQKAPEYQQNPEAFFKAVGHNEASFKKDLAVKSEANLRAYLGLRDIIEKESITLDKDEIAQAEKQADEHKTSLEQVVTNIRIDKYLRGLMLKAS
ncbi:MAG TPA: trigger factor [Candidatus Gracilibacteria bacterium]